MHPGGFFLGKKGLPSFLEPQIPGGGLGFRVGGLFEEFYVSALSTDL